MIGMGKDGTAKPRGKGDRTPSALQWGGTGEKGGQGEGAGPSCRPHKDQRGRGDKHSRMCDRSRECF